MAGNAGYIDPNSIQSFDAVSLAAVLAQAQNLYRAKLKEGTTDPKGNFVKVGPLDLTTTPLNMIKLPSPMKSIVLKDVSDETVRVKLVLNTDAAFAKDAAYPMDHNEVLNFESPIPYAYLTWDAQAGKTATLYIGIDAEIRSGKVITVQSGTVGISEGLAPTTLPSVSVGAIATVIVAADPSSRVITVENRGVNPIYLGDATVIAPTGVAGEKSGITLMPGATVDWRNGGALYGITGGTNEIVSILQQK